MTEERQTVYHFLGGEHFYCTNCSACLDDKFTDEVFVDEFLWETFAYLFCSADCRDAYIDSK